MPYQAARRPLKACAQNDPGDGSLILPALDQAVRTALRSFTSFAANVWMSRVDVGLDFALSENGNPSFQNVMRILRELDMVLQLTNQWHRRLPREV